nr:hypothetical protein [Tanacetum cinerariifolium]
FDDNDVHGMLCLDSRVDKGAFQLIYNTLSLGEYKCSSLALNRRIKKEEVVPKVDDVSLVDGVFNGAFGGDGEEDFVIGEGVVVSSSSLVRSTKSCQGGMMVSLIFLEGFIEDD